LRLRVRVRDRSFASWDIARGESNVPTELLRDISMQLSKVFEFGLPLAILRIDAGNSVRLRFSAWREELPIDALPLEGWIELQVTTDEELRSAVY